MRKSIIGNTEIKAGDVIAIQSVLALKYIRIVINVISNSYTYVFIGYIDTSGKVNYMPDEAQILPAKTHPQESYLKLTNLQLPFKLKGSIITNLFSNV